MFKLTFYFLCIYKLFIKNFVIKLVQLTINVCVQFLFYSKMSIKICHQRV